MTIKITEVFIYIDLLGKDPKDKNNAKGWRGVLKGDSNISMEKKDRFLEGNLVRTIVTLNGHYFWYSNCLQINTKEINKWTISTS